MNFYPWFIRDYEAKAKDLSWQEDLALRRLLDLFYDTERPLTPNLKRLFLQVGARTKGQQKAVGFALDRYFTQTSEGWVNQRAIKELDEINAKLKTKRENGKRGGRPRKEKADPAAHSDGFDQDAEKPAGFFESGFDENQPVSGEENRPVSYGKPTAKLSTSYKLQVKNNRVSDTSVVARAPANGVDHALDAKPPAFGDDAHGELAERGMPGAAGFDAAPQNAGGRKS